MTPILAESLNSNIIVTPYLIGDNDQMVFNDPLFLNESNLLGFANFDFDNNSNVVRTFVGKKKINHKTYSSFATQLAESHLAKDIENFNLFKTNRIKYYGRQKSFFTFDKEQLFNLKDKSILSGKIVIIGYVGRNDLRNEFDIEDKHFTPLNKEISGKRIPDMHGSIIHANIVHMLLNNYKMKTVSIFWNILISVVLLFIGIVYFIWLEEKKMIGFLVLKRVILFVFTVLLMWLVFWFFSKEIVFDGTVTIGFVLLGCSLIIYYKWIIRLIQKRIKWESYF